MKTPTPSIIAAALWLAAPFAGGSTYLGSWKNTTFGSTGALKIQLTITKTNVSGSLDLDGPVFGAGDPPAIPFSMKRKSDGSGSLKLIGTPLGDITAGFKADGTINMSLTNIPGFLDNATVNGRFDLKDEKFAAVYRIYASGAIYAEGTAAAHVHKPPTIKAPSVVKFTGKGASVNARVITNASVRKFTAKANAGAKASVTGKNPYEVIVKNITKGVTLVTLEATNSDGLKTTKVVKLVRNNAVAPLPD